MKSFVTSNKPTQILISLMKRYGIKKVVISPGTTNICFVGTVQSDPYFECYSAPDERSAAYIACGLSMESGEIVAINCTGATASRNYMPGLTEAYYRQLPILVITGCGTASDRPGHLHPQVLDRTVTPNDVVKYSLHLSPIKTKGDEKRCIVDVNQALSELVRRGGGPVHIDLPAGMKIEGFGDELPSYKMISRYTPECFPEFPKVSRTAIFVGAHPIFSEELTAAIDKFCEMTNAVVLCDHTSNYKGKYRILMNIITDQIYYHPSCLNIELMIHIGSVSGAYAKLAPGRVWRVNADGEFRDTFGNLESVFECDELTFFEMYSKKLSGSTMETSFLQEWKSEEKKVRQSIKEFPFSNIWMASQLSSKIPQGSRIYLGILNSLRSWNFFEVDTSVYVYSNTGGFGIDGAISTTLGASLTDSNKLFYCVTGDLGFFYDMNACGNRFFGNNMRILLVNNGVGTEFCNYMHRAHSFGEDANEFIAARGHYGNMSRHLVKHYAEDLGFTYLSADNKEEFLEHIEEFTSPKISDRPIIFETFTESVDESDALYIMHHLVSENKTMIKRKIQQVGKKLLNEKNTEIVRDILGV